MLAMLREPSVLLPATTGCLTPEPDPLNSQPGLQLSRSWRQQFLPASTGQVWEWELLLYILHNRWFLG